MIDPSCLPSLNVSKARISHGGTLAIKIVPPKQKRLTTRLFKLHVVMRFSLLLHRMLLWHPKEVTLSCSITEGEPIMCASSGLWSNSGAAPLNLQAPKIYTDLPILEFIVLVCSKGGPP